MTTVELAKVLQLHAKWLRNDPDGKQADLFGDLRGADLSGADLREALFCRATIDGAKVKPTDIGGPGWILAALTDSEWETVRVGRDEKAASANAAAGGGLHVSPRRP